MPNLIFEFNTNIVIPGARATWGKGACRFPRVFSRRVNVFGWLVGHQTFFNIDQLSDTVGCLSLTAVHLLASEGRLRFTEVSPLKSGLLPQYLFSARRISHAEDWASSRYTQRTRAPTRSVPYNMLVAFCLVLMILGQARHIRVTWHTFDRRDCVLKLWYRQCIWGYCPAITAQGVHDIAAGVVCLRYWRVKTFLMFGWMCICANRS